MELVVRKGSKRGKEGGKGVESDKKGCRETGSYKG